VNDETRTLEQVYRSAVSGLYARLRNNYDFIYRRFGDDGIQLITDMSREYGLTSKYLHFIATYNGKEQNDFTI